jgi:hypothetical protein
VTIIEGVGSLNKQRKQGKQTKTKFFGVASRSLKMDTGMLRIEFEAF